MSRTSSGIVRLERSRIVAKLPFLRNQGTGESYVSNPNSGFSTVASSVTVAKKKLPKNAVVLTDDFSRRTMRDLAIRSANDKYAIPEEFDLLRGFQMGVEAK